MNGAMTLVGAFLGAMVAFLFQIWLQKQQEKKTALVSTHRIMFCLLQQINTLVLVQKDFIYPYLKDPVRFISIPALHEFNITKDLFDFSTFGFMLDSSQSRTIMYDLYLAQASYVEALRSLNERSVLHRQELQPRLSTAGIGFGKAVTLEEIEKALGPLLYPVIVNSTEQTLDGMRGAFQKLLAAKIAFRAYAASRFKSNDFTDFEFSDTYGLTDVEHAIV